MTSTMSTTEARNPATTRLDELTPAELLRVMNDEDHKVADAVAAALPQITAVVETAIERLKRGGRIICRHAPMVSRRPQFLPSHDPHPSSPPAFSTSQSRSQVNAHCLF